MYNYVQYVFLFFKLESIQRRTLSQHSAGPLCENYELFQSTHVLSFNCLNNMVEWYILKSMEHGHNKNEIEKHCCNKGSSALKPPRYCNPMMCQARRLSQARL